MRPFKSFLSPTHSLTHYTFSWLWLLQDRVACPFSPTSSSPTTQRVLWAHVSTAASTLSFLTQLFPSSSTPCRNNLSQTWFIVLLSRQTRPLGTPETPAANVCVPRTPFLLESLLELAQGLEQSSRAAKVAPRSIPRVRGGREWISFSFQFLPSWSPPSS